MTDAETCPYCSSAPVPSGLPGLLERWECQTQISEDGDEVQSPACQIAELRAALKSVVALHDESFRTKCNETIDEFLSARQKETKHIEHCRAILARGE